MLKESLLVSPRFMLQNPHNKGFEMKNLLVLILVLFTAPLFAGQKGISKEECQVANIPSSNPFAPRAILGSNTNGNAALRQLQSLAKQSATTKTLEQDLFLNELVVYSLVVNKDTQTDINFPAQGCTSSATLSEICEYNKNSLSAKCGMICQFNFSCVDNR